MKRLRLLWALITLLAVAAGVRAGGHDDADDSRDGGSNAVEMTWMSIANWYFKVGGLSIVMDGYISRVPGPPFFVASPQYPADVYATTIGPKNVEVANVARAVDALGGRGSLDYLLAGHSHFDHSWDTPTWSKLTGAPIIGGLSTCYQAEAQGVPKRKCMVVNGGEAIQLGRGVTMYVVRFNHSGNASNPIQHYARELSGPPTPDPVTGGLRAGVGEDYPNGGGGRAFLFTVDQGDKRLSFFVHNSASAFDLDQDIVVDGVNYGAPLENLKKAMQAAKLTGVDVYIGTGGTAVASLIVPVVKPKVYIPNHWDGLFNNFWTGLPFPYKDDALKAYLDGQGIALMPEHQYFDGYRLDENGVTRINNHRIKHKLGFPDTQPFDTAMMEAVTKVASTAYGDDCGENDASATEWSRSLFAHRFDPSRTMFMYATLAGSMPVR